MWPLNHSHCLLANRGWWVLHYLFIFLQHPLFFLLFKLMFNFKFLQKSILFWLSSLVLCILVFYLVDPLDVFPLEVDLLRTNSGLTKWKHCKGFRYGFFEQVDTFFYNKLILWYSLVNSLGVVCVVPLLFYFILNFFTSLLVGLSYSFDDCGLFNNQLQLVFTCFIFVFIRVTLNTYVTSQEKKKFVMLWIATAVIFFYFLVDIIFLFLNYNYTINLLKQHWVFSKPLIFNLSANEVKVSLTTFSIFLIKFFLFKLCILFNMLFYFFKYSVFYKKKTPYPVKVDTDFNKINSLYILCCCVSCVYLFFVFIGICILITVSF